MKKPTQLFFATTTICFCFLYLLTGCGDQEDRKESQSSNKTAALTDASKVNSPQSNNRISNQIVKSIDLPHDEADFPPGKGRDLFISRCNVCHSLRYITMQPDFPEATWAKEVDKMINTFGAHITEPEAKQIIEYLTKIKGKPAKNH